MAAKCAAMTARCVEKHRPAAAFTLAWVRGINQGAWNGRPGDLETLLGRKPVSPEAFLRARFAGGQP